MKTLSSLTLAAVLGMGAAHAGTNATELTETERAVIMTVAPHVDLAALSESQVADLQAIVNAPDYERNPATDAAIEDVLATTGPGMMQETVTETATLTETERAALLQIVPEANLDMLSEDQVRKLQVIANQPADQRHDQVAIHVQEILDQPAGAHADAPTLTATERSTIMGLVPGANLYNLTADQVDALRVVAQSAGADRDGASQTRVEEILGG